MNDFKILDKERTADRIKYLMVECGLTDSEIFYEFTKALKNIRPNMIEDQIDIQEFDMLDGTHRREIRCK